jgi:hypothetical protein
MVVFDVNILGIVLATIASMAVGAVWYMVLARQWMQAVGKTEAEIRAGDRISPFVWAAFAQLVMAAFIARLTPAVTGDLTWFSGMVMGVSLWVGFIATSMVINHRFQGQKWSLTFIDGGYLLAVVLVQGAVLGVAGNG